MGTTDTDPGQWVADAQAIIGGLLRQGRVRRERRVNLVQSWKRPKKDARAKLVANRKQERKARRRGRMCANGQKHRA